MTGNSIVMRLALVVLFGLCLSIPFLNLNFFHLSWVAFIPLLIAVDNTNLRQTYFYSLIGGLITFTSGTYWVFDFVVISKGYGLSKSLLLASVYWLYCAHLIALLMLIVRWLQMRTHISILLTFPVVLTSMLAGFPMLFTLHLGETQVFFPQALQGIEFTGVHGLNFIIALVNASLFCLIKHWVGKRASNSNKKLSKSIIISSVVTFVWLGYGHYAWTKWNNQVQGWQEIKVGIVQPNETPELNKRHIASGYSLSYLPEMEMSARLASLHPDIIIWPEGQYKGVFDKPKIQQAYLREVAALNVPLLLQDFENSVNKDGNQQQFNSATLINPSGEIHLPYRKLKRIPFGEYVPFDDSPAWLKNAFEEFLGEFLNEITAGDTYMPITHSNVTLLPLICYETTFPDFVANAVASSTELGNTNKGLVLVGVSNDGWFGSTHQPYQHIMASALRAVENRTPLMHVANNGPSIAVTPSGKIIFVSELGRPGGYLANVPYANTAKSSFYSRHPNLFISIIYILLTILVFSSLKRVIRFSKAN